uniref:Uncharacterized protein n=1 Tax=Rhizophora mucronata TaxID=61149 RepID=A0A2P2R0W2_RHIMU
MSAGISWRHTCCCALNLMLLGSPN